jgi:hypothetical protein
MSLEEFQAILEEQLLHSSSSHSVAHSDASAIVDGLCEIFQNPVDKVILRRSACLGQHIAFHLDHHAIKTMQVALNDEEDYEGGRLTFVQHKTLCVPKRPCLSITMHGPSMVHGVSELISGIKYGLLFIHEATSEKDEDETQHESDSGDESDSESEGDALVERDDVDQESIAVGRQRVNHGMKSKRYVYRRQLQARTGLTLKISLGKRLLKRYNPLLRIGLGGYIYFTAVLEYIASEIVDLAGNVCIDLKKKRIAPNHVNLAITHDHELCAQFSGMVISCT